MKERRKFSLRWFMAFCVSAGLAVALLLTVTARSKPDQIKHEVNRLTSHQWAGLYSNERRGVDDGPLLIWVSPSGGAFAETLDWWQVKETGSVEEEAGALNIEWDNPNRTNRFPTEKTLIHLKYDGDYYLLAMNKLHPFCLAARGIGEFPYAPFRRQHPVGRNSKLRPHAQLELPPQFDKLADLPTIHFKVTDAEQMKRNIYSDTEDEVTQSVVVNAGSQDCLFEGMRFGRKGEPDSFPSLTIESVGKNQSTATVHYFVASGSSITEIKVGEEFETSRW